MNAETSLEPVHMLPTVAPTSALEAVNRAEIDMQVATAKRFPRDVKRACQRALEMATSSEDVAADCFYVLKRKDARTGETKTIEGPSIRLAEIFASCWGNLAYGFRSIADDGRAVIVEGVCVDYETNVRVTKQARRNVLDRNGRRFGEDLVTVTTMAAGSIACRNAVFGVIPGVYVDRVLEAARSRAVGDQRTLGVRRDKAIGYFKKLGVEEARILAALGRATLADVTGDDVVTLRGLATAIREGDAKLEETFPAPRLAGEAAATDAPAAGEGSTADRLARQLGGGEASDARADDAPKG